MQNQQKGKRKHKHFNKSKCCSPEASPPSQQTGGSVSHTPCSRHSLHCQQGCSGSAAVAGQCNLSEGVGTGLGLNLCDTAKQEKSQEGQSGEYLCLIVRQIDSALGGVCKAAITSCNDRFVSCLYNYIPKVSSVY